jgi:hypothetical protein
MSAAGQDQWPFVEFEFKPQRSRILSAGGVGQRIAQCRFDNVKGRRPWPDDDNRSRIKKREQAAKTIADSPARDAESFPLTSIGRPCPRGKLDHHGFVDVRLIDEVRRRVLRELGEEKNQYDELVSADFNHDSHSSVVHTDQTKVIEGNLVRVMSWYDNEWGFSNRMNDTAVAFAKTI